jgi:GDPmannose 4,6-dehydratase
MRKKIALITGITGQDGSYLAEFLLKKNYIVHGIKRKSSSFNTSRIDHLINSKHFNSSFFIHYGDLLDSGSLQKLITSILPDELYNLAAQSHVAVSFDMPIYTSNVNAIGVLNILEIIKSLKDKKKIKFYQASSSEMFGGEELKSLNEKSLFKPNSPYAISKLFSYWITINYRKSFGIYAVNGILFNHESERRGETFVTRKVTIGLSRVFLGLQKSLILGNLNSTRDWGHAEDFVEMQWKIMQQKTPDDYVIATGKNHSIRDFIFWTCQHLGFEIKFKGKGLKEIGVVTKINKNSKCKIKVGDVIIKISKKYFRPSEVPFLLGDSNKAKKNLKWTPKHNAKNTCKMMVDNDYKKALEELYLGKM